MLEMNSVGKPYAGNLHVRFDEGLLVEKPAVYSIVKKIKTSDSSL